MVSIPSASVVMYALIYCGIIFQWKCVQVLHLNTHTHTCTFTHAHAHTQCMYTRFPSSLFCNQGLVICVEGSVPSIVTSIPCRLTGNRKSVHKRDFKGHKQSLTWSTSCSLG